MSDKNRITEELKSAICHQTELKQDEIIKVLQNMVRLPSVTHPPGGDEGRVQVYVEELFRSLGLEVDVFEPTEVTGLTEHEGYWSGLDYTGRPNVVGVWKGEGGGRTLILNGHCDVVPEGPRERWNDDPFSGTVEDGRLYGRGSVDMKGGIAAMAMAVDVLKACGIKLKGDVILESVVNEELGGYNGTLACIVKGYHGDAVIVTEPSDMKIEPANKGGQAYRITVEGVGAHTSFWWEGVSALDKAIIVKKAIEDFSRIRYEQTRDNLLYSDPKIYPIPALTDCIYSFHAGDPSIMGVPNEASMELMIDVLPGESLEEVKAAFEKAIMDAAQKDPWLREHPPRMEYADMRGIYPTQMELDNPIIDCLKSAYRDVVKKEATVCGFESACDAMMFNMFSNTPALIFGPGQLGLAHRPNEYMDLKQLIEAVKILAISIADFCGVAD